MRQDDPLSPYLFLLVQDSLSHLLNAGALSGDFKGIKIKRSCSPLSHLFFADDYIFFCEMEDSSINFLNEALAIYNSLASGQVINLDKSGSLFLLILRGKKPCGLVTSWELKLLTGKFNILVFLLSLVDLKVKLLILSLIECWVNLKVGKIIFFLKLVERCSLKQWFKLSRTMLCLVFCSPNPFVTSLTRSS